MALTHSHHLVHIHGTDGPVLLVGHVYNCTSGHEVLTYHPDLLRQATMQEAITFALWHCTGFTSDMSHR